MNEAQTRAELIDPRLKAAGWGVDAEARILREHPITAGRIQSGGRGRRMSADYVLVYKGIKLAVVEAKSDESEVGEGVAQAKEYAAKLQVIATYATNGRDIYHINMESGAEAPVDSFHTPEELWNLTFAEQNQWREKFAAIPFEDKSGSWQPRYYQEIAINNVLEAVANGRQRILLTLATGTGKTAIAFQISWRLFQTRWNLSKDSQRRPRILFLADRNTLANQAFTSFTAFPEDALVRISPSEVRKHGRVPTNGSIFFTIFQTFMSGTDAEGNPAPNFGEYPPDYFDFIIIDECHRGGANDESNWRGILEYFSPAVQLGLTATPKRQDNADTYKYFGEPVFIYSLKEGINDGFLTPFKVKRIKSTLDDYIYTSDDQILVGEVEQGRLYKESDFNRIIEIKERESKRVQVFMDDVDQKEKSIVFCANQDHAAAVRDLINQVKRSTDPDYCVRVTANDGERGDTLLGQFQDNDRTIPTVLTTSHKLSTGVDARNVRNIVLMRPVNSMIEFKQIIGRGTRLFDGKEFFTIYDFVDACHHFADPEWDGEPVEEQKAGEAVVVRQEKEKTERQPKEQEEKEKRQKVRIRLRDGKEREIQTMVQTMYWTADGRPVRVEEFIQSLYGTLPDFFSSEQELRVLWSKPSTRKALLEKLEEAGYGRDILTTLQRLIDAEKSDLMDVLEFIAFAVKPMTREARVEEARRMFHLLTDKQRQFLDFVLGKYIESGVEELDEEKLPRLLELKYQSLTDAVELLGDVKTIRHTFIDFQRYLYQGRMA